MPNTQQEQLDDKRNDTPDDQPRQYSLDDLTTVARAVEEGTRMICGYHTEFEAYKAGMLCRMLAPYVLSEGVQEVILILERRIKVMEGMPRGMIEAMLPEVESVLQSRWPDRDDLISYRERWYPYARQGNYAAISIELLDSIADHRGLKWGSAFQPIKP